MKSNIAFGVELHDKRRIEDAAATAGLSVAEWCRVHLLAAIPDDDCPQEVCSGPGWFTIMDSRREGKNLYFDLKQDNDISCVTFVFENFDTDEYHRGLFSAFLWRLDYPRIKKNTGELHGKRIYLPLILPAIGKVHLFSDYDLDYILVGDDCDTCPKPKWALHIRAAEGDCARPYAP